MLRGSQERTTDDDQAIAPFDNLPTDTKLHIFSFLNTRDMLNVLATNHANAGLSQSREIWQMRMRVDFFGTKAPPDVDDAREYYKNYVPEKELLCAYVRAACNAGGVEGDAEHDRFKAGYIYAIQDAFLLRGVKAAVVKSSQMAEWFPEQFSSKDYRQEVNTVYRKLFESSTDDARKYLEFVFARARFAESDEKRLERRIAILLMKSIGIFASTHSFKLLYGQMTPKLKLQFSEQYYENMIIKSMPGMNLEFVSTLLDRGVDANTLVHHYRLGANFEVPMLYFVMTAALNLFERRGSYKIEETPLDEKLESAIEIAKLLVVRGTNVDAVIIGDPMAFFAVENTLRETAVNQLSKLDNMQDITGTERDLFRQLLSTITDAPRAAQEQDESLHIRTVI